MLLTAILCAIIFAFMICGILFFPRIKIAKNLYIDSYWVITLIGASILLAVGIGDIKSVFSSLIADTAINPLKILALFICITVLSVFLDELGFFSFLAEKTLEKAGKNQYKLFIFLYLIVSILTVFTSNDIIILSFTPFICYFSKNAKINPLPYLAAEFVGANTWSMALIIGNPTNIYLATAYGIDFISYLKVMILPTLVAGFFALAILLLLFRKDLSKPINEKDLHLKEIKIKDKLSLIEGVVHLGVCTIMLVLSSYIHFEMWLISLVAVSSLVVSSICIAISRKRVPKELLHALKRAPWQLIPFIISMFALIIILKDAGITTYIANAFGNSLPIIKYGVSSFIFSNIINNIPMSVLFSSIIESASSSVSLFAVYSTIIGSNLGALFTPIGALAGIMFVSILKKHDIKYDYFSFLKVGVIVGLPTLALSLLSLFIVI